MKHLTSLASSSLLSALLLAAAFAVVAAPGDVDEEETSTESVNAFWNDYEVDFTFSGFKTFYSCTGLRDKVKYVLEQLGAREDLKVRAMGCEPGGGPSRFPRVKVNVALPMAATAENLAELEKEADKRELVARVRGERYVDPSEEAAQFPATLETVRLSSRDSRRIEEGDCELMEQIARRLLPELGFAVTDSNLGCIPGQKRLAEVMVEVQALKKVPSPDQEVEQDPVR